MGNVIDKNTLTAGAAKLITVLVPTITYLLSLESDGTGGEDECGLTEAQAGGIRGLMVDRNATCAYNMSLISILN